MDIFRGTARRSVGLQNKLKRQQKEINQEVGWDQFIWGLLGHVKLGFYFKWDGELWKVSGGWVRIDILPMASVRMGCNGTRREMQGD